MSPRIGCALFALIVVGALVLLGWLTSYWVVLAVVVVGVVGLYLFTRRFTRPDKAMAFATNALNTGQLQMAEGFYGRLTQVRENPQFALSGFDGLVTVALLKGEFEKAFGRLDQIEQAVQVSQGDASPEARGFRATLQARRGLGLTLMGELDKAGALHKEVMALSGDGTNELIIVFSAMLFARREEHARAYSTLVQWTEAIADHEEGEEDAAARQWLKVLTRLIELFVLWEGAGQIPEDYREGLPELIELVSRYPGLSTKWSDMQVFLAMLRRPEALSGDEGADAQLEAFMTKVALLSGRAAVPTQSGKASGAKKRKIKRSLKRD